MTRSPAVLVLIALLLACLAWWFLTDAAPPADEAGAFPGRSEDAATQPGRTAGIELVGRPPPEVPVGEWRAAGTQAGELSGRVVDAADAPVPGVTVRLVASKAAGAIVLPTAPAVRTSGDGLFRFAGLPAGAVRVVLEHGGMARVEREVAVPATDLVFRLAGGRTLEGLVRAADGSGVADAAVHLRIGASGGVVRLQTVSGRDGRFEFGGLAYTGVVSLAADAGTQGRARPIDLPWRLGRPVVVELDPPEATVAVRVTVQEERADRVEARAREPMKWQRDPVFWEDEEAWHEFVTDEAGSATLALPVGAEVTFEAPALPPELAPKRNPSWTRRIGAAPADFDLRVVPRGTMRRVRIAGRVVDESGAPVPGALVGMGDVNANQPDDVTAVAWPSQPRGVRPANGEGRFAFEADVPRAPAGVFARAPGRRVAIWALPPPPSDVHDITLTLRPGSVLVGRVVDDAGASVPRARISLHPRGWLVVRTVDTPLAVLTGPDGEYRVEALSPRAYRIDVTSPEGATVWPPVHGGRLVQNVGAGETRAKDIVMRRGGVLAGTVLDDEGTPIANALVSASHADGTPWNNAWTDASGRFEVRGLARGRTSVRVGSAGFVRTPAAEVNLPLAAPYRVVLEHGREVRGRVLDARGEALPRAVVLLNVPSDANAEGVTQATANGRGVFVMAAVPPGSVWFLATAPGHAFRAVAWEGTSEDLELRALAMVLVAGQVLDHKGQPAANVEVTAHPWQSVTPDPTTESARATRSVRTDAEGRFRFADLYLERYSLEVKYAGTAHRSNEPALAGREDIVIRLPVPR